MSDDPRPGVAILIPMLGRHHRVEPLMASITATTPEPYDVWFIVSHDDDDGILWFDEHKEIISPDPIQLGEPLDSHVLTPNDWIRFLDDDHVKIAVVESDAGSVGDYARKLNIVIPHVDRKLIFLGAIDLEFHPGWLEACEKKLHGRPQIGVVGTNDLCNKRTMKGYHSTHSLLTAEYAKLGTIDDPTRVLCELYPHEFVDDEFVRTAQYRGAFVHAIRAQVEHLHPMCGGAPMDALYEAQDERLQAGRVIFEQRAALWGGRGKLPMRRRA